MPCLGGNEHCKNRVQPYRAWVYNCLRPLLYNPVNCFFLNICLRKKYWFIILTIDIWPLGPLKRTLSRLAKSMAGSKNETEDCFLNQKLFLLSDSPSSRISTDFSGARRTSPITLACRIKSVFQEAAKEELKFFLVYWELLMCVWLCLGKHWGHHLTNIGENNSVNVNGLSKNKQQDCDNLATSL